MLCERCKKNNAAVFYKESINGREKSLALCEKCAAEAESKGEIEKISLGDPFFSEQIGSIDKLFGSLFGLPKYKQTTLPDSKKCTLCGATFADLVSEGKAGCPECYKVFADELADTINRIHGTTVHNGNAPSRFRYDREKKKKIESLEDELKKALKEERYERAAEIRDELKILRKEEEGDER